jgi:hypothetical protein
MLISHIVLAMTDENIMFEAEILALVHIIMVFSYPTQPGTGQFLVQSLDV